MLEMYEVGDTTHIHTARRFFSTPHSFSSNVKIGAHIQLMMVAHIFAHFVSLVDANYELNKFGVSLSRAFVARVLLTHESIS